MVQEIITFLILAGAGLTVVYKVVRAFRKPVDRDSCKGCRQTCPGNAKSGTACH